MSSKHLLAQAPAPASTDASLLTTESVDDTEEETSSDDVSADDGEEERRKRRWIQISQRSIAQLNLHGSPEVKGCAVNIVPHCDGNIECGFKRRGVGDIDDDEDDDVI